MSSSHQQDDRKVFVGGISWDTSEDRFAEFFSKWGTVERAEIMKDHKTGKPRGFGFVTFVERESVDNLVSEGRYQPLDGRNVEVKRARPRGSTRVFLGGLQTWTTEETLRSYFEQFGAVDKVNIALDPATGRSRCFGFVEYQDEEACNRATAERYRLIDERNVEVKKATLERPRPASSTSYGGMGGSGMGGMGGGGMEAMGMFGGAQMSPNIRQYWEYYMRSLEPQQMQALMMWMAQIQQMYQTGTLDPAQQQQYTDWMQRMMQAAQEYDASQQGHPEGHYSSSHGHEMERMERGAPDRRDDGRPPHSMESHEEEKREPLHDDPRPKETIEERDRHRYEPAPEEENEYGAIHGRTHAQPARYSSPQRHRDDDHYHHPSRSRSPARDTGRSRSHSHSPSRSGSRSRSPGSRRRQERYHPYERHH